jgi:hypothetical protein
MREVCQSRNVTGQVFVPPVRRPISMLASYFSSGALTNSIAAYIWRSWEHPCYLELLTAEQRHYSHDTT